MIQGKKSSYNGYIGELLNVANDAERTEIMGAIKSYVDDLINNGDENVQRYTGKDAQKKFEELKKNF